MEMSIFKKDDKTYTRFKVRLKEFKYWQALLEVKYCIDTSEPVKKKQQIHLF
jgi:hypothetical protein|nr:MAG TPA: hypothetical protein [Caudoviricetes sp.]